MLLNKCNNAGITVTLELLLLAGKNRLVNDADLPINIVIGKCNSLVVLFLGGYS